MSQVQLLQAAQGPESPLLHSNYVAVLQVEVGEVGGEEEGAPGQLLKVVVSQVKFHRDLRHNKRK